MIPWFVISETGDISICLTILQNNPFLFFNIHTASYFHLIRQFLSSEWMPADIQHGQFLLNKTNPHLAK